MASFQFPASPTEGQVYAPAGGPQYVYRAPYWRASGRVDTIVAETPPAGPKPGQLWFNSATGNTYIWYEDPNSAQWVQINVGTDASSSVLTPERFGADPTGVASSDAAFDALAAHVNSIGGNCTIEMTGRYKITAAPRAINYGNVLIDGRGTGLIDTYDTNIADNWAAISFAGPGKGPDTLLVGSVARWATTITVADGSSFVPGSRGAMTSMGEYIGYGIAGQAGYRAAYKGELFIVRSVAGNVLTLEVPLRDSYDGVTWPVYVRRVDTIRNIKIQNLRGLGTGNAAANAQTGVRAFKFDYCDDVLVDNLRMENFPRFALESTLGFDHKMTNCFFQGRTLTDPSNLPRNVWFTGWFFGSVWGVEVHNCSGNWLRRIADPDAGYKLFDVDDTQTIPSRDIRVIGGHSRNCENAIGGHHFQNMIAIGHRGDQCFVGVLGRGRDLQVIGGTYNCSHKGIVVGFTEIDPTTYTEDPDGGDVIIDGVHVKMAPGVGYGLVLDNTVNRLKVSNSTFEAQRGFWFGGKNQSNVEISDCTFKGNGSADRAAIGRAALTTPFVTGILSAGNWDIHGCTFENWDIAIDHPGVDPTVGTPVSEIKIYNNKFKDILTSYFVFGGTRWGSKNSIWGNRTTGAALASPVVGRSLLGYGLTDADNEWGPIFQNNIIAAGQIGPIQSCVGVTTVRIDTEGATATDDLTDILGGVYGQMIVVRSHNTARVIVLKHALGKLDLGGADISLTHVNQRILLVRVESTGGWTRFK